MMNSSRYVFIFNPAADKGRASRWTEWLEALVSGREDSVLLTTKCAGHAEEIARAALSDNRCMIACGGDGTLHEVINAIAGEGTTVGVFPIGSANDFEKTLHPYAGQKSDISYVFNTGSRDVDLGSVAFGQADQRYFINSLGIGFTGRVAKAVKSTPWLKGELGYVHALFSVLRGYTPLKMHITITLQDSVMVLHEPVFAFSVSNGKIEGGKFRIAPHADLSDGLLDVCILKAVSKYEFFRYVFKYLNGTHISDPKVIYCKAKAVDVTLAAPEVMHMDGEVYDNMSGRIAISVVPQGIRMLCSLLKSAES